MLPTITFRPVAQLVSTSGRTLPLLRTQIRATARGGISSVLLTQLFENPYDEILSVTYSLPLPADAAISGFAFVVADRRVVGEVDRKARAKARYQRALRGGHSAALVEQERSSLFVQQVGNIPARSTIAVELLLDQRLLWLPEGSWEWRFPTVVAARYQENSAPREPLAPSLSCSLLIEDRLSENGAASSPSHHLTVSATELAAEQSAPSDGIMPSSNAQQPKPPRSHDVTVQTTPQRTLVSLSQDERKDRDLVVRWPAATARIGATLATCRPEIGGLDHLAFGLLTLVPPTGQPKSLPRDLILLLDVSGSMEGAPLQQMKEVSQALIATLSERDQLEILAFSDQVRAWRKTATHASEEHKDEASQWINALQARGGTQMKAGILAALKGLRPEAQRQVILMTDGLIGAEHEIIEEVYAHLPPGSRVHTLGIGSAVNRSLTAPVARAGAGVEQIVGLRESAEKAAGRLVARTNAPLVVGLRLGGSALLEASPSRLPDLYAASPSLLSLKLRPEGGELWIEGDTADGPWMQTLQVAPLAPGQGEQSIAALYAREAVEDAEMSIAAGRPRRELNQQIEDLGIAFQISTRLTSWLAVSEEATVDASAPQRQEEIPQDLPEGMREGFAGLRRLRASLRVRPSRAESTTPQSAAKTRNLGFVGHLDAGATTLREHIMYHTGLAAPEVQSGYATMDSMLIERERGISIQHAATSCEWGDYDLNLLNLPRHATKFAAECIQSALESVILVVDATANPEARTLRQLKSMQVPYLTFLNKLDRAGSDYQRVRQTLQERLGIPMLLVQRPIGAEEKLEGLIDLVQMRACYFDGDFGQNLREEAIPAALLEEAQQHRRALIEALADADDTITEAFLAGRELSAEQLQTSIREACLARKAAPVFLGSAFRHKGIPLLLDGIVNYLPSPQEATHEVFDENQQRLALTASAEKAFVGRVFALENFYWGAQSYLRIYQGHISKGDMLYNCTTKKKTRSSRLVKMLSNERQDLDEASAGDIIAVSGGEYAVGDTLTHGDVLYTRPAAPTEAVLSVALTYQDKDERVRLEKALHYITREDMTLRVRHDEAKKQIIIAGTDELHLELFCERLRRELRWGGIFGEMQVEYQESPEGRTLEPIMAAEIIVPLPLQGAILTQLSKRRGVLTDSTFEEDHVSFTVEIPMRTLLGYHLELRNSTQGTGELRVSFLRYEPR